ncbi:MAG: D-2-hydroxyacid dehydrogenase [Kiritimatiellaeota bacterium]|nr:D-2-hydroxyacid dehydrogenase [Kiritimatiellota bacterium]
MKIVVLDGHTLNGGDLSWDGFRALGPFTVFDRTPVDEIVQRAGDAEAVLTNKTPLNRETIRRIANLKYIGVLATGCNVVNVVAAAKRGVVVTNVPEYATASVAEHVFACLFEQARHLEEHAYSVRKGRWCRSPDFCYWLRPMTELAGLTLGLVGYGHIGQAVARRAAAFDLRLLVHTRTPPGQPAADVRFVDLDTVFRESDFVSLHCPLTPETEQLVNAARLAQMKPTALLLNTARGGLIDEEALAAALNGGRLAGAMLDVLSEEPPGVKQPLLHARNCSITPHNAWTTRAARQRLMALALDNLKAFLAGHPQHVVTSPDAAGLAPKSA